MLMKQHSYAFYNGYLSEAYKTRKSLEYRLKQLETLSPVQTPSTTPTASSFSKSSLDHRHVIANLRQYNQVSAVRDISSDISRIAAIIEFGKPLDIDQIQTFERIIKLEIDALSDELRGKSSTRDKNYPKNLTLTNHYEFIVLPTLVYELEYPRSEKINWAYVAEKAIATLGILFIMMLVSQTFIYPVVMKTIRMKEAGMPLYDRLKAFPWILSDLIFPFMIEYMVSATMWP
jgi:sterol O-acyltransferase